MTSLFELPSLRAIAVALDGEICGNQVVAPAPGHSKSDRSMSVKLSASAPDGFIVFGHAGDGWPGCKDYVRSKLGIKRESVSGHFVQKLGDSVHSAQSARNDDDTKRMADAVSLFRASVDPIGTPAETYFASRGLEVADLAGRVIRWNPRIGAVVALFRNVNTGQPQAISRTFLDANARKIERKFLGSTKDAAVMLDGFSDVTQGLHVGEGIETAQAARQLGLRPCWALGSKGGVRKLPVLGGVETLTILAENDGKCDEDVEECAARWHAAGREVLINRPIGGKDLNDVIKGAA